MFSVAEMDHQSLILGELRGFKEEALRRLDTVETILYSLQKAEWMRRGKTVALTFVGSIIGSGLTLLAMYLWH